MLHFSSRIVRIYWEEEIQAVRTHWLGYPSEELWREGLNEGLKLLQQKKAHRWVGDIREMHVLSEEQEEWIQRDWTPRAIAAGLTVMAVVMRKSNIIIGTIMKKAAVTVTSIRRQQFEDLPEAMAWLALQ